VPTGSKVQFNSSNTSSKVSAFSNIFSANINKWEHRKQYLDTFLISSLVSATKVTKCQFEQHQEAETQNKNLKLVWGKRKVTGIL
jgi:hypothetical protein